MQKSESSPAVVLQDSDYFLPCNGVGDTGHAKRTLLGPMSKDSGANSSRINQIIRQAEKYPGPGKYLSHTDWTGGWGIHGGNKFAHGSREYKPAHKGPDPRTYERKDLAAALSSDPQKEPVIFSNFSRDVLSKNRRILHGKIPTGKKRSFLDQAERHAATVPEPGRYHPKLDKPNAQVLSNKMNPKVVKMTQWSKEMVKTVSRGKKVEEIGPNHYSPNWNQMEERPPGYSVPKEQGANFLDRAVKEKLTTRRPPLQVPGPGHYDMQNFNPNKVTRGTFHAQLRGVGRSTASGYL
eukprot:TRINITY_DN9165_c0_g1_i1.p2 TRINITY_DN9165_c0_g1~~TRINITY_DN9165_c0_g1_i1.p2  ORF type:complete len:294 (+),score=43.65 TRINITY_DN9165_c0_g1_i1:100-981(+)